MNEEKIIEELKGATNDLKELNDELDKEMKETFTCANCGEEFEVEARAEYGYEEFGEFDLCETCYECMKEDMR